MLSLYLDWFQRASAAHLSTATLGGLFQGWPFEYSLAGILDFL